MRGDDVYLRAALECFDFGSGGVPVASREGVIEQFLNAGQQDPIGGCGRSSCRRRWGGAQSLTREIKAPPNQRFAESREGRVYASRVFHADRSRGNLLRYS